MVGVNRDSDPLERIEVRPVQPGPYDDIVRDARGVEDALVALHSSPAWATDAREPEASTR